MMLKNTRQLDRSLSIRLKNDYFHGFKKDWKKPLLKM